MRIIFAGLFRDIANLGVKHDSPQRRLSTARRANGQVRGKRLRRTGLTAVALMPLALLVAPPAQAQSAAASTQGGGDVSVVRAPRTVVRPGPSVLYREGQSPLLENDGVWTASPILVSGSSAYRSGEFLYQDYLFDESGKYPASPEYSSQNNADLVELRIKPLEASTAVRLTLNSMQHDFEDVAATIALGDSRLPLPVPHGANATMPAQVFVTVHGMTGDIVDAVTGQTLPQKPIVVVDARRRQVDIRIPATAFDAKDRVVRVGAAVGLWDQAKQAYRPQQLGSAFMNVGFRYSESGTWANNEQTAAQATGDQSRFSAQVDFRKLSAKVNDDMPGQVGGVPQSGLMSRIYASNFEQQQGRGPSTALDGAQSSGVCQEPCNSKIVDFPGQLQPYQLFVPSAPPRSGGYGLVYAPHACGLNYRGVAGTEAVGPSVDGNALNALVVYPEGRGGCHWYWSLSGADVFEAVGDATRHFPVDSRRVAISGSSMGGYGTYRLSAEWPDLFAALAPVIGCTAAETGWAGPGTPAKSGPAALIQVLAPSWRNVPIHSTIGKFDTDCNTTSQRPLREAIDQLGYRYEWREYAGDHSTGAIEPSILDSRQYTQFLQDKEVVQNPERVTYVYNALADQRQWGLDADHAYWLSGIKARTSSGTAPMGTIDVTSHGLGSGTPPVQPTQQTSGPGYTGFSRSWGTAPQVETSNTLDVHAVNISAVTIDVTRAHINCNPKLNVTSDGPISITLAGCEGSPPSITGVKTSDVAVAAGAAAHTPLAATGLSPLLPSVGSVLLLGVLYWRGRRRRLESPE